MKTDLFPETVAKSVVGNAWEELAATERKEIQDMLSSNIATASHASWSGIDRTISGTIDITDDVLRMNIPVLYVYGGASKYREMSEWNALFFMENLPSAQVVRIEDGIHDLHMHYPDRLVGLIAGFPGEPRNDGEGVVPAYPFELARKKDAEVRYADGEGQAMDRWTGP
ncbi:MAG TPA: hypothetical protein VF847_01205 [Candidatus Deferrimicrobiaceae bacterium]